MNYEDKQSTNKYNKDDEKINEDVLSNNNCNIKDYFNQRLILPQVKPVFDYFYNSLYKCLICNDTLFDPILCEGCKLLFCRSCISNKGKNNDKERDKDNDIGEENRTDNHSLNLNLQLLDCKHTTICKDIPDHNKKYLEKINIDCYFRCANKTLNLFNYPAHVKLCKEKNVKKQQIISKPTKSNSVANSEVKLENLMKLQEITETLKRQFDMLSNKIAKKEDLIKFLQSKLIDIKLDSKSLSKQIYEYISAIQDTGEKNIQLKNENDSMKVLLDVIRKENVNLKKQFDDEKYTFFVDKQNLEKDLNNLSTVCEELEKKVEKLTEEKNNLMIFNSSSQSLSDDEKTFRKLVKENINPELTSLVLYNKKLKDDDIKYLSQCDFLVKLTKLDLRNNDTLTETGINYFSNCIFIDKLTTFKLKWNFHDIIGIEYLLKTNFLKNLTELDLSHLDIGDKAIELFSNCIYLENLTYLNLSHNLINQEGLEYLSDISFLKNLESLNLSNNNLIEVKFYRLKHLFNLKYFDLSDSKIVLLELSDNHIELISLDLSGNHIDWVFNYMALPKLEKFNLSRCGIAYNGIRIFCSLTTIFYPVKELNLKENTLTNEGLYQLAKCDVLTSLNKLNLCQNKIEPRGIENLIKCSFKQITYLDLSENEISNEGLEHLSKCGFKCLMELNLSKNQIGSKGMEFLSLCNFRNLKVLNLSTNFIGTEGMKYLTQCNFKSLTTLDLSICEIGNGGMEYLPKCEFNELNILNLSINEIKKEGVESLSKCEFKYLTKLDLSYNDIGKEGIEFLSLCNFKQLSILNLDENKIGKEGLEILSNCDFNLLTDLNLCMNMLGTESIDLILNWKFKNLTELNLRFNGFGFEKLSKEDQEMYLSSENYYTEEVSKSLRKMYPNTKIIIVEEDRY